MKKINELKMVFDSRSVNEGFSRVAVSAFSSQLDMTVEELGDIKTVVSEAVTNAIVHGYRNPLGIIEMTLRLYSDGAFYIKARDRGCGISDVQKALTPMYTTAPAEEERSGLGFTVMESFTDALRVKSALGKGTTVTMEKRLSLREKPLVTR